jgi:prepilin-type N-terminal cleavage/methylation domain-containing protein/prepilin-type processing-associated H-X9-DG protein
MPISHRDDQTETRLASTLRAFTLVELLVVIAIVVLLMALLMPVLSSARETARRAICGSQLHQWSIAYNNYSASNNGWFPGTVYAELYEVLSARDPWNSSYYQTSPNWRSTNDLFAHYGMSRSITYCPSHAPPMLRPSVATMGQWGDDNPPQGIDADIYVDYFVLAGVVMHRASGFGMNPKTLNESSTGPFAYCGWDQDAIFEGRYGRFSQGWGPVWKSNQRRRQRTPMIMDTHYLPGPWNNRVYLQWKRMSNHKRARPALPDQPMGTMMSQDAYAEGANALFLDGSVGWNDLRGQTFDQSLGHGPPTSVDQNFVYGGNFFQRFYLNAKYYDN